MKNIHNIKEHPDYHLRHDIVEREKGLMDMVVELERKVDKYRNLYHRELELNEVLIKRMKTSIWRFWG